MCLQPDRRGIDHPVGRGRRLRSGRVAVIVALLLAPACSDGSAPTDDDAYRAEFIGACQAGVGAESGVGACGCWYERLSSEVPFEDLPDLDDLTAPDSSEDVVAPELYERLADCVRAFAADDDVPVTAPPPLTLPPAPTTTVAVEGSVAVEG